MYSILARDAISGSRLRSAKDQFQRDVAVGGISVSLRILFSALTGIPFAH